MTHRQFLTWHLWLREEWENPDRHDVYIMMLAREVHTILMKSEDASKVNLKDFRVKFKERGETREIASAPSPSHSPNHSIESRSIMGKTAWASRIGNMPGAVYTPAPTDLGVLQAPPSFSSENS